MHLSVKGHNRFHYKCCKKETGISMEDVKQQSLKNAEKSRKSRNNLTPPLSTSQPNSPTTKEPDIGGANKSNKSLKALSITDAKATALQVHMKYCVIDLFHNWKIYINKYQCSYRIIKLYIFQVVPSQLNAKKISSRQLHHNPKQQDGIESGNQYSVLSANMLM